MTKEKKLQYKKAHIELYEIIQTLSDEEKAKIPDEFMYNLKNDIDNNYIFYFDKSKTIFEQDLMVETKALLVQLYAKYLAPENETELWKKYNRICFNKIEAKRREKYNPDNIFENKFKINNITDSQEELALTEIKNQTLYRKILDFFKKIFKKSN